MSCFCFLVSVIFLILVEIGNTNGSKIPGDIYFFKLDLSDIVPQSTPNLQLTNSIARTLGLHDFYQVGLWSFCEGYNDEGITFCSKPKNLYWFNPVEIVKSELFSGASIALPNEVNSILGLIRIASNIMFGFFLTGLILNFVLIFAAPIVLYSKWWSLPVALVAGFSSLMVSTATCIGTTMSLIFKYVLTSQVELNIVADIGVNMFAFMWIATAFTGLSFIIHAGLGCCCTSRRDIRTGRKSIALVDDSVVDVVEEKPKRSFKIPKFGRRNAAATT